MYTVWVIPKLVIFERKTINCCGEESLTEQSPFTVWLRPTIDSSGCTLGVHLLFLSMNITLIKVAPLFLWDRTSPPSAAGHGVDQAVPPLCCQRCVRGNWQPKSQHCIRDPPRRREGAVCCRCCMRASVHLGCPKRREGEIFRFVMVIV